MNKNRMDNIEFRFRKNCKLHIWICSVGPDFHSWNYFILEGLGQSPKDPSALSWSSKNDFNS